MPGYTLVDASVQYDLSKLSPTLKGTKLSVIARNIFDKYYVSQCTFQQGCTLGSGRAVLATLNYQW
jgi:iron complex outermembrane receptor protein